MTKKLETLFNLDSKENTLKESTEIEGENDLKEPIIPVIEPEIPIIDPHHHLWDIRKIKKHARFLQKIYLWQL